MILSASMDCRAPLRPKFIQCLLGSGAEATINTPDMWGYTPLLAACERRDLDVVVLLLDRGARTDVVVDDGKSPSFCF